MIQEMMESLYDNLKQKDYERSKAEAFNASKGWFDNFRKEVCLFKCQDNRSKIPIEAETPIFGHSI